jgi:thiol-disulfide isomerase/thioredoxin
MRRLVLVWAFVAACGAEEPRPAAPAPAGPTDGEARPAVEGTWRATLATAGGELPFTLVLERRDDSNSLGGFVSNGPERIEASRVEQRGRELVIGFDVYDSEIRAELDADALTGRWIHTMPKGPETMAFAARRGDERRFVGELEPPAHAVPASLDGDWSAVFTFEGGPGLPAHGVLASKGERVDATFLTETGDFRHLEGRYEHGRLELSCFDGAHAFLLRADVDASGALEGEMWAMAEMHAKWRATKMAAGAPSPLADPTAIVGLSPAAKGGRLAFAFPDLQGDLVAHDDPRFVGKVVVVDVFGTWCPNCNDQAPLLARWHRQYGPRGLEIVGLAFEMTGEPERDRAIVTRYAEHHGLEFPLLLAGTSDKQDAAAALPGLERIVAYPTTILVGRDGKVRRVYTGFSGPATGEHHTALVATMERELEALLGEAAG